MQQVVVQLFNGLGNQMFQYAAGRRLAATFGASLRLVHHVPPADIGGMPSRPLLLQHFNTVAPIAAMTALDRLAVSTKPYLRFASQLARRATGMQLLRQDPNDIARAFDFSVDPETRTVCLSGYYQESGLVDEIDGALRQEFRLQSQYQGVRTLEYADRIRSARRPVSIHLRHGDYVTTFGPGGLLPLSYYQRAIESMLERFWDVSFFVFSDDIPFANYWARNNPRMTVVDCNDPALAHECMHLMSLCRHHIIANSTFSWWGAWLNNRADKVVIAPDSWLGFATSEMPVACASWKLLPAFRPPDHSERVARFVQSA